MKAITQEWINFAKADLRSCENNLNDEFLTSIVAFHCQQAVEKCFKAIIEEYGLGLKRIHNLFSLYNIIKEHVTYEIAIDKLELLDELYTSSRYPGEIGLMPNGKPNQSDAIEMYDFAQYIFDRTTEMLSK